MRKILFFDYGIETSGNYKDLFINPNNNPTYGYSAFGIHLSMGIF